VSRDLLDVARELVGIAGSAGRRTAAAATR